MRKVKMTSFKAYLGFTVTQIDLIFNEFSSKERDGGKYSVILLFF